ncbi:hypothetical protein DFS33DRAFT_11177 [Desarmillaria ectypa]|nr:hypothetical protein DFS33DRAFT_11177 [Desarmillaria ectypa]
MSPLCHCQNPTIHMLTSITSTTFSTGIQQVRDFHSSLKKTSAYRDDYMKGEQSERRARSLLFLKGFYPHCRIHSLFRSFDLICDIIGYGLREDVRTAYDVFLDMCCLGVFSRIPFHPCLVKVVKGYVSGLHGWVSRSAPMIFAQYFDYLHQPENFVIACMILAVNNWESVDPERIKMDIMGLVQLRPWDPVWPICRERLQDLVESDQFFSSQRKLDRCGDSTIDGE